MSGRTPEKQQKSAIVTGGSRGIGAAVSYRLARDGWAVSIVFSREASAAASVVAQIRQEGGVAAALQADVSDENAIERAVESVADQGRPIGLLVNNAGIAENRLLLRSSLSHWQRTLDVNLTGTFLFCKHVLPHMLEHGQGTIVNVSSNSVWTPGPGQTAYAASKGGIEALTRAIAVEFGAKGIRANVVAPGRVRTDMTEGLTEQLGGEEVPGSRWGTPEDIAGVVAFLSSEDANYIQGETVNTDGGRLLLRGRVTPR